MACLNVVASSVFHGDLGDDENLTAYDDDDDDDNVGIDVCVWSG